MGPQRFDDADELPRAAVGQVVAVDAGDDDVLEPERAGGFGDVEGFEPVDRPRHPGLDVAEGAGPRARIAEDHHRGVLLRPAFPDVGARRLLAHRRQAEAAHQRTRLGKGGRGRRADAQPVGLAGAEGGSGVDHLRVDRPPSGQSQRRTRGQSALSYRRANRLG